MHGFIDKNSPKSGPPCGMSGNVRELRNAIERAVALTCYERIVVEDLPDKIRTYRKAHLLIDSDNPTELVPMEEVERRYIHHVLTAALVPFRVTQPSFSIYAAF